MQEGQVSVLFYGTSWYPLRQKGQYRCMVILCHGPLLATDRLEAKHLRMCLLLKRVLILRKKTKSPTPRAALALKCSACQTPLRNGQFSNCLPRAIHFFPLALTWLGRLVGERPFEGALRWQVQANLTWQSATAHLF